MTPPHPTPIDPQDFAVYDRAKMGKSTLFKSERLLVGLNAFEPGQEHKLHAHAGLDKVYHVLAGSGLFLLDGREVPMTTGTLLIAPVLSLASVLAGRRRAAYMVSGPTGVPSRQTRRHAGGNCVGEGGRRSRPRRPDAAGRKRRERRARADH